MNAKRWRRVLMGAAVIFFMGALLAGGPTHAQSATFTQQERIERMMDNSPGQVVAVLESILTQQQIAALEAALLSKPTGEQKRAALEDARQKLLQAGFAEGDPAVAAIESRTADFAVSAAAQD